MHRLSTSAYRKNRRGSGGWNNTLNTNRGGKKRKVKEKGKIKAGGGKLQSARAMRAAKIRLGRQRQPQGERGREVV